MTNEEKKMVTIKSIMIEELKAEGLDIAEDAAISAMKALFKIVPKVILATENKVDDLVIPVLGIVESKVIELLDKIDGEQDQQ